MPHGRQGPRPTAADSSTTRPSPAVRSRAASEGSGPPCGKAANHTGPAVLRLKRA